MIDSSALLATGGIAAAVVAGWSQVKNVFSYLSSFIVVNAHLDPKTGWIVRAKLRRNWKLLPSGLLTYRVKNLVFKDRAFSTVVPFRLPSNRAVYRLGWRFIFLSGTQDNIRATFLRGTMNFDAFLSDAIDQYEEIAGAGDEASDCNRFQVIFQIGREKGMFSDGDHPRESPQPTLANYSESAVGSGVDVHLDESVDKSFKYSNDLWMFTTKEDPFKALYFPEHIIAHVEQARQWKAMSSWYAERQIPWRRGWLLHGPGGTGKSSLAKALAQELRIPINQFFLSTLSDQEFINRWSNMVTPCVALLEDFDNVFKLRESLTEHKSLTFDCVLNQISGVASTNGVFLIVTTNRLDYIDPAMGVTWGTEGISTRPGRIDTVIEVGMIDKANRRKLANRILRDWPELVQSLVDTEGDITPVQFQEMCLVAAYSKLNDRNNVIDLPMKHLTVS